MGPFLVAGVVLLSSCGTGPVDFAFSNLCSDDERVVSGACVACPAGSTNAAGDLRGGANTSCDCPEGESFSEAGCAPATCGADQRVVDNECVDCTSGQFSAGGALVSGPDTTCAPLMCAVDQRVEDFRCVDCPTGSTQPNPSSTEAEATECLCPPGSLEDTTTDAACDARVCDLHERVAAHACVPCSDTERNDAGDLATGADTSCEPDPCFLALGRACRFARSYVKATQPVVSARFGSAVALDAEYLVVGAPEEGGSGAAYVYARDPTTFAARFSAPGDEDGASFGTAVAVSSGTVVIGAPGASGGAGAVYIYTRTATGTWSGPLVRTLGSTGGASDRFGFSVAVEGDDMVVGAPGFGGTSPAERGPGAAVVLDRRLGEWEIQQVLSGPADVRSDGVGFSVALDGDRIAVGAPFANGENGRVLLFERTSPSWSYLRTLSAGTGERFGAAVAVRETAVLVGAPVGAGRAYYFANGIGPAGAPLDAPTVDGDGFGSAVALGTSDAVVGAPGDDSSTVDVDTPPDDAAPNSGAFYVFERGSGMLRTVVKAPNPDAGDAAGVALGTDGSVVSVGAPAEDGAEGGVDGSLSSNGAFDSGAVYLWTLR